jgi:predicted PurR-regulated permease PerM
LIAVGIFLSYKLLPILELVAVAVLVALILRTFLRWLQKIVKVRWLAVLGLVGLMGGFGAFLGLVVVPNLLHEAEILLSTLPRYLNTLIELSHRVHRNFAFVPDLSQGLQQLRGLVDQILNLLPLLLKNTLDVSLEAIATLILSLYMAYDPQSVINGVLRLAPRHQHQRLRQLIYSTQIRLQGWIFGTAIAMLIIGIGAAIGLLILGVPLVLSFGVLAGILEVIPYFGSIVGALLPALVALTLSPAKALLVLVWFLILNQADVHLVQPIVMGQRVNLHPVMVILAFLVMGKLLGLVGVLLAVPAAAVLVTLIDELTSPEPTQAGITIDKSSS